MTPILLAGHLDTHEIVLVYLDEESPSIEPADR
jgi:hypothetical protein